MIYIGIDPGVSGALAYINDDYDDSPVVIPYNEDTYCNTLQMLSMDDCKCCIEQVHSMPKQGVASTFTFGKNFGILLGMLKAFGIPFQEVRPQVWKKEFGLNSDKANSIEVCQHLFPSTSLRRTERCKTDHDGMAEALLMAEYARRRL